MTLGAIYQYIYLTIVTLLSIECFHFYKKRNEGVTVDVNARYRTVSVLLLLGIIVFIGLRPVDRAFVDMVGYEEFYRFHSLELFEFDREAENLIWDNMILWFASMGIDSGIFFLVVSSLYFGFTYAAIKRLFPKDYYAAFLVFLAAFSTFSYGTNGIKAGLAGAIFCFAISYREKLKICIPLVLLTYAFHHSMVIPIAAFIVALLIKNPHYYLILWFVSLLMAFGHVTYFQELFSQITDERGAEYLVGDMNTHIGFRPDFVLYSSVPIFLGWFARVKKGCNTQLYTTLLNVYTLANSVWMVCMYANFNNRIAYLSWFLYPIVLIYPILNENWQEHRYLFFSKIGRYHLLFTLFMFIVYYGIFKLGS